MDLIIRWRKWLFVIIVIGGLLTIYERYRTWREDSHDPEILAAATRYGIHPALVKAVVWRESKFDPEARGRKGELGLMQIMPDTAKDWAAAEKAPMFVFTDMLIPAKNTRCGAWYLRKLLLRYTATDNPLPYALADYNAGRGNVLRWMQGPGTTNSAVFVEQIGFPSTKQYVITAMERFEHYRNIPMRKS